MQKELENYTKAQFWKCALQVNPFNYYANYRNKDHGLSETQYNKELRRVALESNIKILGIANHGSVEEIDNIRKAMEGSGIIVFPGFEIESTEKIHFVCLYPEDTSETVLNRYLGALHITNTDDGTAPSTLGASDLIRLVTEDQKGFIFAAHCTGANGILAQKSNHIWKNPSLKAAQVQLGSDGTILNSQNYENILKNKEPAYKREKTMVLIHAKDIAIPEDLQEPSATSLIRMTKPSFSAFLDAFCDPESRIRLNTEKIEHFISVISSVKIVGGYLNNLKVDFSENLNTIIGGRGTGKSTLIEFIRYAFDIPIFANDARKTHDAIIKENLGKERAMIILTVQSEKVGGKTYTISRKYGESPIVKDENGEISSLTPQSLIPAIAIYGQNEIYEISQDNNKLAELLNRIIQYNDEESKNTSKYITSQLLKNREALIKIKEDIADKEVQAQNLSILKEQLELYKEAGIEKKLSIIPFLETEKRLLRRVREETDNLMSFFDSVKDAMPDSLFLDDSVVRDLPQKVHFEKIRNHIESMKLAGESILLAWKKQYEPIRKKLDQELQEALDEINIAENELESTFAQIKGSRGKSGKQIGNEYQKIIKDIEKIKPQVSLLEALKKQFEKLENERKALLLKKSENSSTINAQYAKAIKILNKKLSGDLKINYEPEANKQSVIDFLCSYHLPNVAEGRLGWIRDRDNFTNIYLAELLRKKDIETLKKHWNVTPIVANALMELSYEKILELEEIEIPPQLSIELNVSHTDIPKFKKLEELSTGQQCTAILHLLLLENNDPLILDQPEDNLDNAFVAERIVSTLRKDKLNRQFIFATHNANIPVFGDAEWIGVFSADNQNGQIPPSHQGAIDLPIIKELATNILEGGREAFLQRKEKYGIL